MSAHTRRAPNVAAGPAPIDGSMEITRLPVSRVRPSPENEKLYRPVDPNAPDIKALAESIGERGILEPLIVSADGFIISGHRRFAAAKRAGLTVLPCRIREDVSRRDDPDGFLRLLCEANRQRVKSFDEQVREEVVAADPDAAYASLIEHRRRKSDMSQFAGMELGAAKRRAAISKAKDGFLAAVQQVLDERRNYLPLSDRQIHYALLTDPPLIHGSKPASRYRNDLRSYKALTELLARARIAGLIPFASIADETRPVVTWDVHRNTQDYIRRELDGLLKSYWRDLLQSEPNHIELIVEKNTILPILRPVAMEYCIPITSGRGYCSLPPRWHMAQRFRKSGREKLVLLLVSDFDPDGEAIAQSFARSMRDDFGVECVEAKKIALTAAQVKRFKLPPMMKAKAGCSTRAKFVGAHGEHVHEVEALAPADLQAIVRNEIDAVLDVKAFNRELDQEKLDAAELEAVRCRILAAMGGEQ